MVVELRIISQIHPGYEEMDTQHYKFWTRECKVQVVLHNIHQSNKACLHTMTYSKTYHAWRRTPLPYPLSIVRTTESLPKTLKPHEVLIRIHAVSLNYRDVAMLREGGYPVPVEDGGISASDGAAEVIGVGEQVDEFRLGDHVAPTVDLESLTGDERDIDGIVLGGNGPGLLRQYAIFEEQHLVKLPKHLPWEEVRMLKSTQVNLWLTRSGRHLRSPLQV